MMLKYELFLSKIRYAAQQLYKSNVFSSTSYLRAQEATGCIPCREKEAIQNWTPPNSRNRDETSFALNIWSALQFKVKISLHICVISDGSAMEFTQSENHAFLGRRHLPQSFSVAQKLHFFSRNVKKLIIINMECITLSFNSLLILLLQHNTCISNKLNM